jgi:hypothetical protein
MDGGAKRFVCCLCGSERFESEYGIDDQFISKIFDSKSTSNMTLHQTISSVRMGMKRTWMPKLIGHIGLFDNYSTVNLPTCIPKDILTPLKVV